MRKCNEGKNAALLLGWPLLIAGPLLTTGLLGQPPASDRLPERFERYLETAVKPTPAERKQLLGGAPITKLLDADPSKEVVVFGAVWVRGAAPEQYVALAHDIENFERGGSFRVTKKIGNPPKPEDFAQVDLPREDVADLRTCAVGRCDLKLGQATIDEIRAKVDFSKPTAKAQVDALFRERMYDYVMGYRDKGNAGLAVYRDTARPMFVADEFASMIGGIPALAELLPDLRRYLLEYPKATLPNSTDFLYWQEARFGLKPTLRINHLVTYEAGTETVIASKMLYASHYFWTALEVRVLARDPQRGPGFWFITVSRSRSDGLSGFVGRIVRGRARSEAQKGILAALIAQKARLEGRRAP